MAASGRGAAPGLEDLLFGHPYEFSFFQAVRLLTRLHPDRSPVGLDAMPSSEIARFRAHLSMDFPASQIQSMLRAEPQSNPATMTVTFMGLTGPLGVLPWHYTELLIKLETEKNPGLKDFFDLFNHRWISLFYRAWEKHRFFVPYERKGVVRSGEPDEFTHYL